MAVYDLRPLSSLTSESVTVNRFYSRLLSIFALMALVLAVLGVFGLMSFQVRQRAPELGLRAALGASPADLLRQVLGQGLWLSLAGLIVGFAGAMVTGRVIAGFLFGVTPHDPWVLSSVGIVLVSCALAASYLPARRAMRVDPMITLRCD
jgi:putative ABC transport system permease protein